MFYLSFEAVPKHDSPEAQEFGGAYIDCWLRRESEQEAELEARAHIDESGWIIGRKEDQSWVEQEDYDDTPDVLQYYQEAEKNGSCYVFHCWPLGAIDDECDAEEEEDLGDVS